jgi:hypothetical protein
VALRQTRSRTATNPKTHHHFSVFFATSHGGVLALELGAHTLLGLNGPMVERGAAQPTHLYNEQFLHFIGRLQWSVPLACDLQDALHPIHDLGMLAELLHEVSFLLTELVLAAFFLLHPYPI